MTARARATEIPRLVGRLGSRRRAQVDAARARLAIIGARAVEALTEALEDDNHKIRANAMSLLALIQDPRGREPLRAMLLDRDARMREMAARCLARFPSDTSVVALERHLKKEKTDDVRVAAVHALIEMYAAGQERAVRPVLSLVFDTDEETALRAAALALLPQLRPSERRSVLRRLKQDPSEEIREAAIELEQSREPADDKKAATVKALIADLGSDDYAVWNEAVQRLTALGSTAVALLVREMQDRSHDPEYCTRAGMVLRGLGPRRGRALAEMLDDLDEPLPLQVVIEAIGAIGDKSSIYRLNDLIERIEGRAGRDGAASGFDPMQRVRAKAHLELARVGSRVAIHDLREALSDRSRRLEIEMLAAVELIGKKDEIQDLVCAYEREESFLQDRIAAAVRSIMKRERIRRNNPAIQAMAKHHPRAVKAILPPATTRRGRRGPRSVRRR
jgi:HEAT repeat protein